MIATIRLEEIHIAWADRVALWRQESAIAHQRPAKNGCPTDYDTALAFSRLGCRGEVAGKLFLNPVQWHAFVDRGPIADLPDLDDFVDVKTRAKDWHNLIVQVDDRPDWAYLLVSAERHPDYGIIGWCWGHEAKTRSIADPVGGRPAHFIRADDPIMKPPRELFDEVRRRQDLRRASLG